MTEIKINNPNAITLMLKFTAIAREQDAAKLRLLFAQMERDYSEYMATVQEFVNLEPAAVVEKLCARFPALQAVAVMPSVADKTLNVIEKAQAYLKEKGNKNVS